MGKYVGSAITQAVNGNTTEISALGALVGEVFLEGFKAIWFKGIDEAFAGIQNIGRDAILGTRILAGQAADKVGISGMQVTNQDFADHLRNKAQAAPLASYIESGIDRVSTGSNMTTLQIAEGVKTGVNESMRAAVSQGVHDAWKQQEAQRRAGAKFSN